MKLDGDEYRMEIDGDEYRIELDSDEYWIDDKYTEHCVFIPGIKTVGPHR